MNIELKDFELAAERLKPILHHTELDHSATFSPAFTRDPNNVPMRNNLPPPAAKLDGTVLQCGSLFSANQDRRKNNGSHQSRTSG